MLASYNWLKKYVAFDLPAEDLAEKMTLHGLEVVKTTAINKKIAGLVIGEVLEKEPHPNADRLSLTKIKYLSDGKEEIVPVVCGAANIASGQKIMLATVGTALAPDFVIKKSKIRGSESVGMVCSKSELGLEEESEGIWELPADTLLTADPQSLIGEPDFIFEIDITSNRPDCLNIYGVAREISAILSLPLIITKDHLFNPHKEPTVKVDVENESLCPRYLAQTISDIKIAPSPKWLQSRLLSHDIRPINNVVDVTNLIAIEYGQPLHAFDAAKVDEIKVRSAKAGETLLTLDEVTLELKEDDLIIADSKNPIALAGVMGGLKSGVTENTTTVIIEAAAFSSSSVRQTSRRHKIFSKAAYYFERYVDENHLPYILNQTIYLLLELTGGTLSNNVTDSNPTEKKLKNIFVQFTNIERTLGMSFSPDMVTNLLKRLRFSIKSAQSQGIEVEVPSFRNDINYEWDLIEEIARIYGYNEIPENMPKIINANHHLEQAVNQSLRPLTNQAGKGEKGGKGDKGKSIKLPSRVQLIEKLRRSASGLGYHEIMTYPFLENDKVKTVYGDLDQFATPTNPVWPDIAILRNQMLFGALRSLKHNLEKGQTLNKAYEVGRVFFKNPQTPNDPSPYTEEEHISFCGWIEKETTTWHSSESANEYNYYHLTGDLEELISKLGYKQSIQRVTVEKAPLLAKSFIDDSVAEIRINQQVVGILGIVKPKLCGMFELDKKVYFAELNLEALANLPLPSVKYVRSSSYPAIKRDVAVVIDDTSEAKSQIKPMMNEFPKLARLSKNIQKDKITVSAKLVNIYSGANIGEGKASVVFSIEFRSHERTLERAEVDREVDLLVEGLQKKYSFDLR